MAWWLEGVTSKHFGWVRNPSEAIFSNFLSKGTKRKNREISDFSEKNWKFRENIGKIGDFSRFFSSNFSQCKFFRSCPKIDFFGDKSAEKSDFLFPGYIHVEISTKVFIFLTCSMSSNYLMFSSLHIR